MVEVGPRREGLLLRLVCTHTLELQRLALAATGSSVTDDPEFLYTHTHTVSLCCPESRLPPSH